MAAESQNEISINPQDVLDRIAQDGPLGKALVEKCTYGLLLEKFAAENQELRTQLESKDDS